LGARAIYVAVIDGDGERSVVTRAVVEATDPAGIEQVVEICRGADAIAIDAPASPSGGLHANDGTTKRGKFTTVPWVTPVAGGEFEAWMHSGFRLWNALVEAEHDPMEVYPAGCFWLLNGRRWPAKKTVAEGLKQRRAMLERFVELPETAAFWSHDAVDATMAAVVAMQGPTSARPARHGARCDSSTIWFPATT
jgi:predicted nuclease with RNAse H fold